MTKKRSAVLTLTKIEGGIESTSVGDRGLKYIDVVGTLEGHPYASDLSGVTEIRVPFEEREQLQIGDWYLWESDDKHNITITKIAEEDRV